MAKKKDAVILKRCPCGAYPVFSKTSTSRWILGCHNPNCTVGIAAGLMAPRIDIAMERWNEEVQKYDAQRKRY